jgi:hypothetical protein
MSMIKLLFVADNGTETDRGMGPVIILSQMGRKIRKILLSSLQVMVLPPENGSRRSKTVSMRGWPMNIVIAPGSYKESLTALEVATEVEAGFRKVFPDAGARHLIIGIAGCLAPDVGVVPGIDAVFSVLSWISTVEEALTHAAANASEGFTQYCRNSKAGDRDTTSITLFTAPARIRLEDASCLPWKGS